MTKAIVGRWGKNLAIRFPGEISAALGLADGERVEIVAEGDSIVIRRPTPRFTLDELFGGKTDEEWRREYADTYDWGPDLGREIID